MCRKISPKVIPLSRLHIYRIFDRSWWKLEGICCMTFRSWAIHRLNWVWSEHDKSGELGNFWTMPLGAWGAAGAALHANGQVFAMCVIKLRNSPTDCCVSWVDVRRFWSNILVSHWFHESAYDFVLFVSQLLYQYLSLGMVTQRGQDMLLM